MAGQGAGAMSVEDVISRLEESLVLDDERFALEFARDKRNISGWGRSRIGTVLAERGISRDLIELAIEGDGEVESDRARDLITGRGYRLEEPSDRQRALGFLSRKGFTAEDAYEAVRKAARAEGLRCEGVVSTSFGCPYEGAVDPGAVIEIAGRLAGAGCEEVGFGDTTGMANPAQVEQFFHRASAELPGVELTAHFHNTRGQGLANAYAALGAGVTSFESSFGELGGCPVPPGSVGNVATEDLVSMFEEMGIATGIDIERLLEASAAVQQVLGRTLGSHLLKAGPVRWKG